MKKLLKKKVEVNIIKKIIILYLALFPLNAIALDGNGTGFITKKIHSPERNKLIEIHYWYPTQNINADFDFGNPKIFVTTKAKLNAKLLTGKFPVILLAHGGMRSSPYNSGWIASALAKSGYIVVVPQPPSPNSLKPNVAPHELWLRPNDLTLGLSSLDDVSILKNGIDESTTYGLGFFLGGTSMLSLAGVKIDPVLYKNSCKQKNVNFDCHWFKKNDVELNDLSLEKLSKIKPENRINTVIAINPELTKTFDKNSIRTISIPLNIIDISNNSSAALIPDSALKEAQNIAFSEIPNSNLYSAFSICTKKGKMILAAEGEGEICKESEESTREQIHKDILQEIVNTLKKN